MSASSGPDRLLPAESFISCDPSVGVRLRTDADRSPDNYPPVSVPTLLTLAADKWGDRTALNVKRDGQYVTWTYREYLSDVRAVAKAFVDLGLEPRHGVAIIGFNSPEWFLADLAAVFAGGMAAGIYPTNNPEACRYVVGVIVLSFNRWSNIVITYGSPGRCSTCYTWSFTCAHHAVSAVATRWLSGMSMPQ